MRRIGAAVVATLLSSCGGVADVEKTPVDLLIVGATVIHPDKNAEPIVEDIAVRDGRIVFVAANLGARLAPKETYDAHGRFIIPGLADMHSHMSNGIHGEKNDSVEVLARHLYFGNTTILNMGSVHASTDEIDALQEKLASGEISGPRLLSVGTLMTMPGSHPTTTIYSPELQTKIANIVAADGGDGPINLAPLRGTTLVSNAADIRKESTRVANWGAAAIKITVESGPIEFGDDHPQMSAEMISAAAEVGHTFNIPVLCHISSLDEVDACLENGATGIAHGLTPAENLPLDIEERMVNAGFVVIPTASMFDGWRRYTSDPTLLDQSELLPVLSREERELLSSPGMIEAFRADTEWNVALDRLATHLKKLSSLGGIIVAGTDTGNPYRIAGFSIHEELEFYVHAGLSPRDALATATINAAKMVSAENDWGSIRAGLSADLIILNENPLVAISNTLAIEDVYLRGQLTQRQLLPLR